MVNLTGMLPPGLGGEQEQPKPLSYEPELDLNKTQKFDEPVGKGLGLSDELMSEVEDYVANPPLESKKSPIDAAIEAGYLIAEKISPDLTKYHSNLSEYTPEGNKAIRGMFKNALGSDPNWNPVEYAWCATFVSQVLSDLEADPIKSKDRYDRVRADKYKNYGSPVEIDKITEGDIVVFDFDGDNKGDHATFYVGDRDDYFNSNPESPYISVLGGNQGDAVNIREYPKENILAVRRITYKDIDYEFTKELARDNKDFNVFLKEQGKDVDPFSLGTSTMDESNRPFPFDPQYSTFNEGGLAESKGLSWGELIVDNILGLDNEYESFGEKLGKAINEDEIKFLKDAAVGVYEGTKEFVQAPVETTKQVVNEIKDSVTRLGSEDLNTRLQRMYGVSYEQATDEQVNQAREAVLGDALTALELVPAAKVTTTVAGAAIPSGLKADVVGQTKAMLSGDREFLSGTPSNRASTQSLSAGFTGQNPPTYLFKDEPPFDPDGIYGTEEGILKFREPIAEFTLNLTRTNSFPSKGMTGAEFLRLLEKNAESIPPSSYKEGLVDKDKRYTREELLDAVTKSPAGLPESIYYNLADLEASPNFKGFQRQSQVGFTGYPRYPEDTSYFSIPILSRTSGNTFKANSQHFDVNTTAHVRGSFIDPMVGFSVDKTMSPEFKSIVGKDRPYLLVEEIQSDLLQKGYRKPKNSFDFAFDRATSETMAGSPVTFQEVYGDLTNELKSLLKSLESKGVAMPEEPVRLQLPYRTGVLNHPQFKDRRRRDFIDELYSPERGTVEDVRLVEFEEIKDYIDKQGVNSSHIYQVLNDIKDGANRTRSINDFESVAFVGPNNKAYDDIIVRSKDPLSENPMYIIDTESAAYDEFLEDFDEYTKKFGLNYNDLADAYDKELDKYYDAIDKEITDRKLDKDAVDGAFVNGLYERFLEIKKDQRLLGDETNTALPPVRKNKQTVEEALKLLIAKADQEGVDKIVIPPASKIAEARGRTIDPSDKGDRFYRTYVADLNKALEDLEKNYPVTIHRDVELPYRSQNEIDNAGQAAANAADDAAINDDDLFTVEEGNQFFDLPEGFFDDVPDQQPENLVEITEPLGDELLPPSKRKKLVKVDHKGIIIDISKLREQFQVDKPRQFAEGGTVDMNQQMSFAFEDGGLRDDGMMRDPVSGNEVPPGSTAKEVRDDIPAQLSEGEYVVPADVVRYYGVKFFEDLRDAAKMGLQDMEARGRIGGEPVPAGGPMNEDDLTPEELAAIQEMMGMSEGGTVAGFAPGGLQTDQDFLAAGQQAQQNQFTGFPLGATMFPRAESGEIEAVPTTPTITTEETAESCAAKDMDYDPATKTCVPRAVATTTPAPSNDDDSPRVEPPKWHEKYDYADTNKLVSQSLATLGVDSDTEEKETQNALQKIMGSVGTGIGSFFENNLVLGGIIRQQKVAEVAANAQLLRAQGKTDEAEMLENAIAGYRDKHNIKPDGFFDSTKTLAKQLADKYSDLTYDEENETIIKPGSTTTKPPTPTSTPTSTPTPTPTPKPTKSPATAAESLAKQASNADNAAQLAAIQKAQSIAQKAADAGTSIAEQTQTGSDGYGSSSQVEEETGGQGDQGLGSGWGGMNKGGLMAGKPKTKTKRQYKKGGLAGKK